MPGHVWLYFTPQDSARLFVACYMLATGLARIATGNTVSGGVNVFSARLFGLLFLASGLALLLTVPSRYRYAWRGRTAAIVATVLWLFILVQTWNAGAWVSFAGSAVFAVTLINEVRVFGRAGPADDLR